MAASSPEIEKIPGEASISNSNVESQDQTLVQSLPVSSKTRSRLRQLPHQCSDTVSFLAPYTYEELPHDDSIRYLVLQPGEGDAPLECSLHVSQLDAMPFFEAISYVWGTPIREHDIKCHNRTLKITTNLRAALRRMRHAKRPRTLWADSICIDQDSIKEKNHQVTLMSRIYSKANRTLVFLGPDDGGHASNAASMITDVYAMVQQVFETIDFSFDSFPYTGPNDPIQADARWSSIIILFRQEWFGRGWVVQEAAVSQDVIVSWGTINFDWRELMTVATWVYYRLPQLLERGFYVPDIFLDLHRIRYPDYGKIFYREHNWFVPSLLPQLQNVRSLTLMDPRDRIYAFMGLPLDPSEKSGLHLQPDYERTVTEVYVDFAQNYIKASGNLDLLHYVQHTNESVESGCPSWVPRWDIHLSPTINQPLEERLLPTDVILTNTGCEATKVAQSNLRVRAVLYDEICFDSPMLKYESTSMAIIADIWRGISEIGLRIPGPIPLALDVYIQTLVKGFHGDVKVWAQHKKAYKLAISRLAQGVISEEAQREGRHSSPGPQDGREEIVHNWVKRYVDNRKVIQSTRGYLGLAPGIARRGDICCIIFGCNTPFVLRRTERPGYYKILGSMRMCGRQIGIEARIDDENERSYFYPFGSSRSKEWTEWEVEERDIWLC